MENAVAMFDSNLMEIAVLMGGRFEVNNCGNRPDEPYWQPVLGIMQGCDGETAEDYECDGDCVATLALARPVEFPDDTGFDDDGTCRWHVTQEDAETMEVRKI